MLNFDLHLWAVIFLALFLLIGMFDGIYFHLIKYQLHLYPESRTEHHIHAARAFVFGIIALPIYVINSAGSLLYFGILLIVLDLGLELADILVEKEARKNLGGVSSVEAAVHIFASMFRTASLVLILAAKPVEAWVFDSPWISEQSLPSYLVLVGTAFSITSLVGGVSHLLMIPGALPSRQKASQRRISAGLAT